MATFVGESWQIATIECEPHDEITRLVWRERVLHGMRKVLSDLGVCPPCGQWTPDIK